VASASSDISEKIVVVKGRSRSARTFVARRGTHTMVPVAYRLAEPCSPSPTSTCMPGSTGGAGRSTRRRVRALRRRRPRARRVLDQRRRRARVGAGRTDRGRTRVPGGDLHAGRGAAAPPHPRRHRPLDAPPGLSRRATGALPLDSVRPCGPGRAGVGPLPGGRAGELGHRRPHPGRLVVEGTGSCISPRCGATGCAGPPLWWT
jgi:hypothetical protein